MGDNLSIFRKGLILVAVPLLFQLAFVGVAWKVRADAVDAQRRQTHSNEVIGRAENLRRMAAEAHASIRGYVVTADPAFLDGYEQAAAELPKILDDLKTLVSGNPEQSARAVTIGDGLRSVLDWIDQTRRIVASGNREAAIERIRGRTGQTRMAAVRADVESLLAEEGRLDRARQAEADRLGRTLNIVFVTGVLFAVAAAVALLSLFTQAITGRLNVLAENARRLAEGQELAPPIAGRDEVARLDVAFRAMAESLAVSRERERDYAASLEQRTAALEGANRELQNFASVASHDLQEPLRKIQTFGDRLSDRCAEGLGETGRDYLERMRGAATRMRTLIDDLLSFSRLQTRAKPFEPVNLAEVAVEVVSDLEGRIQDTGGRVDLGDLPTIEADPTQMRQLLQNLIGNGLKFHRPGVSPVVTVAAEPEAAGPDLRTGPDAYGPPARNGDGLPHGRFWRIMVRDNGIGFDEKYLDRIFDVFQRLHGRGEYEGTGIGLAICRRIVTRHGGRITAESVPDRGATFVVTLPERQPRQPDESAGPAGETSVTPTITTEATLR